MSAGRRRAVALSACNNALELGHRLTAGNQAGGCTLSQADRHKWNARYAQGAYAERTNPNQLLESWLARVPVGRALDVACGAGRNAMYLAAAGFSVDAVDISRNALARAARLAEERQLEVNWLEWDFDDGMPDTGSYDLIIMFRYLNMALLETLKQRLRPGGFVIVEQHLVSDAQVIGPRGARFRVEPGALAAAAGGLQICYSDESLVTDPDGRQAALARLVARKR